jgi:putative tryptophan/tyrosine transport system substrate-binding protein
MRRRDFIKVIAGTAATWPLVASAQQQERKRRIGVLIGLAVNDAQTDARIAAFVKELQRLGWVEGGNVQIDIRGGAGNSAAIRKYSAELLALEPEVILAIGNATMVPLVEATHTVPIVFAVVIDPVGGGFVENLSRPGGNVTGFMMFEYSLSGKWPELLKQVAPNITRVAVLRDPTLPSGIGQFAVIQAAAPSQSLEVDAINVSDEREIERGIEAFARSSNGGLIVTAAPSNFGHRKLIITLAARYKLPAVYIEGLFVREGGLLSYGPNLIDANRRAASYVDRILRGAKPADLPVQAPDRYELVINLKTAKALGLTVSPSFLARADEVIE